MVNTGKDRGKVGKVMRIHKLSNAVTVEGINLKTKSVKANPEEETQGGLVKVPRPVHVSKVSLVDPDSGKPTKIRMAYLKNGDKVRVSKKSGTIIPKPSRVYKKYRLRHKGKTDGPKDTPAKKVLKVSYRGEDFASIKRDFEAYIKEKERLENLLVFNK